MINVLLADSDQDTVKNIKTYIRSAFPELKVIGNASGKELSELEADLLIADVRFFGASGYVMIRDIHERYPKSRIILYGAYNEGEIMVKSMEFGVLDYMYKPIRPAELSRCINSALKHFEQEDLSRREEKNFSEKYDEHLHFFKEMFMKNLMCGAIGSDEEARSSFEYFGMPFDKGFTVFIMRIDQFKKLILVLNEKEKHLLGLKICFFTREMLKGLPVEGSIMNFNAVACIIGGFEALEKLIELLEALKEEIYKRMNIRVTIGIGRTYESPSDISVSYREAESALRYRFHVGYNTVVPIHYMEPSNTITYRYPFEKEDRLVFTAVIGEYNYCKVLLGEIFDSLKECEPLPDKFLSKLVMNVIISINRYLSEQNIPIQSNFMTFFPSKDALELRDIDSARRYLDKTLKSFCDFILEYHTALNAKLIESAKKICEDRFYETFSLPKIASSLGTTPEYLNRLFMDKEKHSVFDFAVKARINEAKRLMRESDMNDDMVAVKVGYDDGRHFRSVFRKYEGVNTSDYRAQYKALSSRLYAARRET
ncbi:MAG: helix-turn-helix domain-containing protein [Clostridiales bacterium]|nr:helix-turn-helix domain-containing protein [Clostridiales bacterium]